MPSLDERFEMLERDLLAKPPRIALMSNLPFAILRYEPEREWEVRKRARLLAHALDAFPPRKKCCSLCNQAREFAF